MNIFDDIPSNIDAVIQKCSYLNFGDQITLASACDYLNYILKNHVWKEKYQTLNIFEKSLEYVVTNETQVNCICLTPTEIQEFQKHYADKVKKLSIKNVVLHQDDNDILQGRMLRKNILNIRQFKNLESLTYRYMGIPTDHLKQIAEGNPNLEELCLVNCSLSISMDELLRDIVLYMKNLKSLRIKSFQRFGINYCRFQEVLAMANLERLHLTAVIRPDELVASSNDCTISTPANLKDLNLHITIDPFKWPNNLSEYFKSFQTLSALTIETVEKLNDKTLAVIAQVCTNLELFNIRATDFENVEGFPISPKVNALSLSWCTGLSCDNLRHLLTQLKITTFHSEETTYDGVFEGSRVSQCIRSLRVDGINTQNFTFPHRNNYLEKLTWHNPISNNQQTGSGNSLTWCTRLRALEIRNGYLPLETVMQLKSLYSLTMPQPIIDNKWYYISGLLKHPTLTELSLRSNFSNGNRNLDLDVPTEGFPTNVSSLNIPLVVFDVGLTFWLDLLTKNKNLKRVCCSYNPHDNLDFFLAKLIYHQNFPASVKNIYINGFKIYCNDLKWNFVSTINELQRQIDYTKCWHDTDMYRIVILR